jgi:hypothetical protein
VKINEVPQDDAHLLEGKTRDLQYALDKDGKYTTVKSVGWEPKNTAMLSAWEYENDKIREALKLVKEGKKSPIYYFMNKCLMDISLLASYTGFSRFRIRRHFKPSIFNKLSQEKIDKYIYAFGLKEREELFKIAKYED